MITYMPLVCLWMRLVMNYPVIFSSCISPLLYLPAVFSDRSNHSLTACRFGFLFFHPAAQCFVCLGCVVCAVLPSSSFPSPLLLPSPNIFGLQLVCFVLLSEFRLQSQIQPGCLCLRWFGEGVNAVRTPAHDKDRPPSDSIGMQIECPSPVSAAAPLLQPTNTTHIQTLHAHMHVSSQADRFTLARLLA